MDEQKEPQWQKSGKVNTILIIGFCTALFIWLEKPNLQGFLVAVFFMLLAVFAFIFLKT